jgi:hypothetical protein
VCVHVVGRLIWRRLHTAPYQVIGVLFICRASAGVLTLLLKEGRGGCASLHDMSVSHGGCAPLHSGVSVVE